MSYISGAREGTVPISASQRQVGLNDVTSTKTIERASGDASPAMFKLGKSRGIPFSPSDVSSGDKLGLFGFSAYAGSWFDTAEISSFVDGAVTTAQRPASRMVFKTNANNAASVEHVTLFSQGTFAVGNAAVAAGVALMEGQFYVGSNTTMRNYFHQASTDSDGAQNIFRKCRGTIASPSNVVSGDIVGRVRWEAYSGGTWFDTCAIRGVVSGAVVSGERPGSALYFSTNPPNTAAVIGWSLEEDGIMRSRLSGNESTASGTPLLGSNCPASTLTAPFKWIKLKSSDGSTVHIPAWK